MIGLLTHGRVYYNGAERTSKVSLKHINISFSVLNIKRHNRISRDPNNTAWTRSSTSFGRKILRSHGWIPGDKLGATKIPRARLRTAASASHIRLALRDGNLGLGATHVFGPTDGQPTGLDTFHHLLGRLNGKHEIDVDRDENLRTDIRRSIYVEQRWGRFRFVSGGFLAGDEAQKHLKDDISGSLPDTEKPVSLKPEKPGELLSRSSKQETQKKLRGPKDDSLKRPRKGGSSSHVTEQIFSASAGAEPESQEMWRPQQHLETVNAHMAYRRTNKKAGHKLHRKNKKERANSIKTQKSEIISAECRSQPATEEKTPMTKAYPQNSAFLLYSGVARSGGNAFRRRIIEHKQMATIDSKALNEVSQPFCEEALGCDH